MCIAVFLLLEKNDPCEQLEISVNVRAANVRERWDQRELLQARRLALGCPTTAWLGVGIGSSFTGDSAGSDDDLSSTYTTTLRTLHGLLR